MLPLQQLCKEPLLAHLSLEANISGLCPLAYWPYSMAQIERTQGSCIVNVAFGCQAKLIFLAHFFFFFFLFKEESAQLNARILSEKIKEVSEGAKEKRRQRGKTGEREREQGI